MARIVIVGAGFGGIAAAVALVRAGFDDLVILEQGDRIGGVWRDNAYPGCGCDIPAPLYSYSFAPNPRWSRRFPPRREILDYLRDCAEKWGLLPRVRLNARVIDAAWDEATGRWRVSTAGGDEVVADVLIPAVGQLSNPVVPRLKGAELFAGPAPHTARWPEGLSADGLNVGVIGTGASAIQLVPAIAGKARHVTVFQRTPPWTLPKPDRRYGPVRETVYRRFPGLTRLPRLGVWGMTWVTGRAVTGHRVAGAMLRTVSNAQRRVQVPDRALRARVTPVEPMGCKRVLFTNNWYPALRRPDVDLVTAPIDTVTRGGVTTVDGVEHPCDVLVYATGFDAVDFLVPMRIAGRGGRELAGVWRDGAFAYLGMAVPGFPNMFLMYGPNTNTGNTSVIFFHEAQARHIVQAVRLIVRDGAPLEVRGELSDSYDAEMRRRLATSVWTGCRSWYRTATGRIVTNWPGMAAEYRRRTRHLRPADYGRSPE